MTENNRISVIWNGNQDIYHVSIQGMSFILQPAELQKLKDAIMMALGGHRQDPK